MAAQPAVALLTEAAFLRPVEGPTAWYVAQVIAEDALLVDALTARGVRCARVAWDAPELLARPWQAAVIRATWDYHVRLDAWKVTLCALSQHTTLLNPWPLVAWNLDKRYLLDLAGRGQPVVPTEVVPPGAPPPEFAALADRLSARELVAKPAVSGGARDTFRLGPADLASPPPALLAAMARERYLVQPFEPSILTAGELSLVVLEGRLSHAVRKTPRPGDFRVQDDHGGRVHPHLATGEERLFAEAVVASVSPRPAYARVDAIRRADGSLALMELELIEPELFLRCEPSAASALAEAIFHALEQAG